MIEHNIKMRLRELILICLIKSIHGKINIDINSGTNASDVNVKFSGYDIKVVTDREIDLFGLDDEALTRTVNNLLGSKSSNIYLKSPTPWGDLYKTYKWEQVSRILTVRSATVKNIVKQPVIVMSQDFDNFSNYTTKVNVGMTQTVENTISTSWTRNHEIAVSQEVEYSLNVIFAKAAGTTGFSYTSSWGKTEEKSETISIGTNAGMETELKPGQSATAVLSANRGHLDIEVVYEATLRGHVAVNFRKKVKGHHFHFPSIDIVLKSAGLTNEKTAVEIIKIGYYTDASLKVYDKKTSAPL